MESFVTYRIVENYLHGIDPSRQLMLISWIAGASGMADLAKWGSDFMAAHSTEAIEMPYANPNIPLLGCQ